MKCLGGLLVALCLLAWCSSSFAAVTIDAVDTAIEQPSSSPDDSTHQTVGSGSNRALIVLVAVIGTTSTVPTVAATWDQGGSNQSMTQIGSGFNVQVSGGAFITFFIFALRNPASGNKTLRVTSSDSFAVGGWISSASFTGVNQTSDAAAFGTTPTTNTSNSTAPSVSVSSATGNIVVGHMGANKPFNSINSTTIYFSASDVYASQYATGAASVTLSGVLGVASLWGAQGVSVSQPATASHCNIAAMGAGKC